MKRVALALLLIVTGCQAGKQSFSERVKERDKTGFYDTYPGDIDQLGDMVCLELRVKPLPLVMAAIPENIPPYSWGVLVGSAVKVRCGS